MRAVGSVGVCVLLVLSSALRALVQLFCAVRGSWNSAPGSPALRCEPERKAPEDGVLFQKHLDAVLPREKVQNCWN